MSNPEVERITRELETDGYVRTSYAELGLPFDAQLATLICDGAAQAQFSPAAADLTKHIEKQHMTMVQDEEVLRMGTLMVAPVIDLLFEDSPRARRDWQLYALNRYERIGKLGIHRDSVGSTVLVATMSGVRDFHVYGRAADGMGFGDVEQTFRLETGSIMILDGQMDPGHSVDCIESPSVSAVFDVPDLLRS